MSQAFAPGGKAGWAEAPPVSSPVRRCTSPFCSVPAFPHPSSCRRARGLPLPESPEEPLTLLNFTASPPRGKEKKSQKTTKSKTLLGGEERRPGYTRHLHSGFGLALGASRAHFDASGLGLPPPGSSLPPISRMPILCAYFLFSLFECA